MPRREKLADVISGALASTCADKTGGDILACPYFITTFLPKVFIPPPT